MSTLFNMIRDINGYNGFGLPFTDQLQKVQLAQNVAQSFTVPNLGVYKHALLIFEKEDGSTIFVAKNTTATVPTGTLAAGSSDQNPTARQAIVGDTISLITPNTTAYVTILIYALNCQGS